MTPVGLLEIAEEWTDSVMSELEQRGARNIPERCSSRGSGGQRAPCSRTARADRLNYQFQLRLPLRRRSALASLRAGSRDLGILALEMSRCTKVRLCERFFLSPWFPFLVVSSSWVKSAPCGDLTRRVGFGISTLPRDRGEGRREALYLEHWRSLSYIPTTPTDPYSYTSAHTHTHTHADTVAEDTLIHMHAPIFRGRRWQIRKTKWCD